MKTKLMEQIVLKMIDLLNELLSIIRTPYDYEQPDYNHTNGAHRLGARHLRRHRYHWESDGVGIKRDQDDQET